VNNFRGLPTVDKKIAKIMQFAKGIGGKGSDDMRKDKVNELLESHFQELMNEGHEVLRASNEIDVDDDAKEEEPAEPMLTRKAISDFLHKADALAEVGVGMDPILERNLKEDLMNL
jgi:hypothetical protein